MKTIHNMPFEEIIAASVEDGKSAEFTEMVRDWLQRYADAKRKALKEEGYFFVPGMAVQPPDEIREWLLDLKRDDEWTPKKED